jgi:hypothetical protein
MIFKVYPIIWEKANSIVLITLRFPWNVHWTPKMELFIKTIMLNLWVKLHFFLNLNLIFFCFQWTWLNLFLCVLFYEVTLFWPLWILFFYLNLSRSIFQCFLLHSIKFFEKDIFYLRLTLFWDFFPFVGNEGFIAIFNHMLSSCTLEFLHS